jgi:hypothetical protein
MKIKTLVLAVLATASSVFAADAMPIHFNAVLTAGKEKHFGLSSSESGAKSSWLTLGESFEGYTLKSFDDPAQTLVLEHDGKTQQLSMAAGSIATANTKATLSDAQDVINKMHFEDMLTRSLDQQKQMVAKMTGQMAGKAGARRPEEKAEFSAFQSKLMETMWAELKPEEVKSDMARAYSEIFSKEELQGLGDFYGTPTGQALISKQPEVQQKLMETMMPRMMKAMPKVQEMAKEYAAAHAPKAAPAPAPSPAAGTP